MLIGRTSATSWAIRLCRCRSANRSPAIRPGMSAPRWWLAENGDCDRPCDRGFGHWSYTLALCCIGATLHLRGRKKGPAMNLEKFTDRARGFLQSAQTVAMRMNHQRIAPAHVLKALLEDEQGMAVGPDRARRRQRRGGAARDRRGAGQDPGRVGQRRQRRAGARRRDDPRARPGRADRPEGRRFLRHRRAAAARAGACRRPTPARRCADAGRQGRGAQRGDQRAARRPHRRHASRPRTATTRSRSSPATSPRRRATASSIR